MTPSRGQPAGVDLGAHAQVDLTDPKQLAIEVVGMRGTLALFQQQLSTGLGNNTSALSALQGDVRDLRNATSQVATLLQAMETHSQGLNRAFSEIHAIAREWHDWRKDHEAKNQGTSDAVTTWRGVVIGMGLVGTLLVSAAIYIVESRFASAQLDRSRIEATQSTQYRETDARLDALERHP